MAKRKKKKNKLKAWVLCLIPAALAAALYYLAAASRAFSDWYALKAYPLWVGSMGRLAGLCPWSVNELAIYLLVPIGLILLIRDAKRIIKKRKKKGAFGRWLRTVICTAGCLFLVFMLGCGINYNRSTFAELSGLDASGGTKEELYILCTLLAGEANALADKVPRDADGLCIMEESLLTDAGAAMQKLGNGYAFLAGYYPPAKPLIWSEFVSQQRIAGIHSPYTSEAQYNRKMTPYNLPHTICHELSHLKGIMREDEANFVGFLACIGSERPAFRYSGYVTGYIYASNALYGEDYSLWEEIQDSLDAAVSYDLSRNTEFWGQYRGRIAEVSEAVNDTYLKINHQEDGVKSYDRVVDLMLDYYRKQLS